MVTDISSSSLNDPASPYAYHRNNGIFMIRVDEPPLRRRLQRRRDVRRPRCGAKRGRDPDGGGRLLVDSQSGVVAPLTSRTAVPPGARLELDPDRAMAPFPELVVVPFTGYGFPRGDFTGEAELHLEDGKITRVLFRAP
jgi:hypothetical protein